MSSTEIPRAEGEAFVGLHSPDRGDVTLWAFSIRWAAADVATFLGGIYARKGETIEDGWVRAQERGWSVALIRIWGHIN